MNKSAGVVAGGTQSSSLAHGGASAGVQVGAPYTGQGIPRSSPVYSRLRGRDSLQSCATSYPDWLCVFIARTCSGVLPQPLTGIVLPKKAKSSFQLHHL